MKKIRDFIYNFNDIFVALIIIIIASGVIFWRVNAIMNYPDYVASRSASKNNQEVTIDDVNLDLAEVDEFNMNPDDANSDALEGEEQPEVTEPVAPEPPKPQGDVKFTVPNGSSADKIGSLLVEAGLIESKQDYLNELSAQKADTKLKAGTFTIPAGSTITDIIKILTK